MKYKNIDSMLHNFGHSFVSLNNYVENAYIVDALPELARRSPNHELMIDFETGIVDPSFETVTHQ